jgi:hypothetical protein
MNGDSGVAVEVRNPALPLSENKHLLKWVEKMAEPPPSFAAKAQHFHEEPCHPKVRIVPVCQGASVSAIAEIRYNTIRFAHPTLRRSDSEFRFPGIARSLGISHNSSRELNYYAEPILRRG